MKKRKMAHELTAVVAALLLILGLAPGWALAVTDRSYAVVEAASVGGVPYVARHWDGSRVVSETRTTRDPWYVSGNENQFNGPEAGGGGWHYAGRSVQFANRVNVNGTVDLILRDGVTLTFEDGLHVPSGSTLNIYAQEGGSGTLRALGNSNYLAAIGGNDGESGGTVTVHGGTVVADCYNDNNGEDAAGIGGGNKGGGGTFTIFGGRVEATGANYGAGIGGGDADSNGKSGGTVRVYGGEVVAKGGCDGAGIGGGEGCGGADVEIWGGTVHATGGTKDANDSGAGIGSGDKDGRSIGAGTVRIHGGEVHAQGGPDAAGIGGGNEVGGGNIIIDGGTVEATGGELGAGIGGGQKGGCGTVSLAGGNITARGGKDAPAVGTGKDGNGGNVRFDGASVDLHPSAGVPAVRGADVSIKGDANTQLRVVRGGGAVPAGERVSTLTSGGGQTIEVRPCGHDSLDRTWTWDDEYASASVGYSCDKCGHKPSAEATVTTEETDTAGATRHTARAVLEGREYVDTVTPLNPAYAYAGYDALNASDSTVRIKGVNHNNSPVDWYVIGYDASTRTVELLSKQYIGGSVYRNNLYSRPYESSEIRKHVEGLTANGRPLAPVRDALAFIRIQESYLWGFVEVNGHKPYILSKDEAQVLSKEKMRGAEGGLWYTRTSYSNNSLQQWCVDGTKGTLVLNNNNGFDYYGVRPALKLRLERVIFESKDRTFSLRTPHGVALVGGANATPAGGATKQDGLYDEMTAVTYTANEGYRFEEFEPFSKDGVTVRWDGANKVTVSGAPTADVEVTVPDAVPLPRYSVVIAGGANATPDGATTQDVLYSAMKTVTFTANEGYRFEEFEPFSKNGVTVQMVSKKKVTVSGTPTADVELNVPDAVLIPAEEAVSYRAWNGSQVADVEGGRRDYVLLEGQTTWEDGTWYVAEGEVSINDTVIVQGTANLILCDGASVTATKGIRVNKSALNVYGQSGSTGRLTSTGKDGSPGIGGDGSAVAIHGGVVTATGTSSAGIGGAFLSSENSEVTIYGGKVTATGDKSSAGIGSSYFSSARCDVAIYGGEVTAVGGNFDGGNFGGAGIGGSGFGLAGSVTLSGGVVTAYGGGASAIGAGGSSTGGDVHFDGATVHMYPGNGEGGQHVQAVRATNVTFGGDAAQDVLYQASEGDELTTAADADRISVLTSGGRRYVRVEPHGAQAHEHHFTYYADGATATATCTDDCPLPGHKATLTISAPALTTYGQADVSAEAVVDDPAGIAAGAAVEYSTLVGSVFSEPSATPPTGAGLHRASVPVGDTRAWVEYRIAKAAPVAAAPAEIEATYGQRLSDVGLANPEGNTDGFWAWEDPSQDVGDAGTRFFRATFTPTDTEDYESATGIDVPVVVGRAESPAVVGGRVAVGTGQSVDLAGCVVRCGAEGEVSYRITGDARGCTLEGSVLSSGTEPGAVTVETMVAEDANFLASEPMAIQVEVTDKATQTLSFASALVSTTYGDTPADNPLSGARTAVTYSSSNRSVAEVAPDGTVAVMGAGRASIVATADGTDDVAGAAAFYVVEVAKVPCAVTAPQPVAGLVEDDSTHELVTPGSAEGGRLQYALGAESGPSEPYSDAVPAAAAAGTYHVWYRAAGDANHLASTPTRVDVVIAERGESDAGGGEVEPTPEGALAVSGLGHVQGVGDLAGVPTSDGGALFGTIGQSRRLEAISLALPAGAEGSIEYRSHVQGQGWESEWAFDGSLSGTMGQARRVEAVQMRLSGGVSEDYSVWYRVHSQSWGWLGWARDGQAAGTAGQGKRAEAVEVQVLPKGQLPADYAEGQTSYVGTASGSAHLQGTGWTSWGNSLRFGTTGEARRLEALRLALANQPLAGGIEYATYVEGVGWLGATDGDIAGTEGESRSVGAVRISLTGEMAEGYSVWYRVHSQSFGWLGWAHDREDAGTIGLAKRAEAVEVQVLPAGQVPTDFDPSVAACVVGQ